MRVGYDTFCNLFTVRGTLKCFLKTSLFSKYVVNDTITTDNTVQFKNLKTTNKKHSGRTVHVAVIRN